MQRDNRKYNEEKGMRTNPYRQSDQYQSQQQLALSLGAVLVPQGPLQGRLRVQGRGVKCGTKKWKRNIVALFYFDGDALSEHVHKAREKPWQLRLQRTR